MIRRHPGAGRALLRVGQGTLAPVAIEERPLIDLLPGFDERLMDVGGIRIRVRTAGSGPPVLLLHGYPQSLVMWHRVAPALAEGHAVVLTDLRGYGSSDKPIAAGDGTTYAKRAMAADQVAVMDALGHHRFAVVGHDRGARVGHRLALDHPERVAALAVLDIVPTLHMFEHVDRAMASEYFHWFFLARPDGLPERLLLADPDAWLDSRFRGRHAGGLPMDLTALAEYRAAFRDPATIRATCADYRAAASIDLTHDRADRDAGRRVLAPLLALWGQASYVGRHFDPLAVWRAFATDVTGGAVEADHYLAEEAPGPALAALTPFLRRAFA
jgi:haloacetate dehalogenase